MSLTIETQRIVCPYCGEMIDILIDGSIAGQHYVEDCSVCCSPIELAVTVSEDEISVDAKRDDE